MAFIKKVTKENGVILNYFRISNMSIDLDKEVTKVIVKGYVSIEKRNNEKNIKLQEKNLENKFERLNALVLKNEESTIEERISLTNEVNLAEDSKEKLLNNWVEENSIELNGTFISLKDCYDELKKDHFKDSKDI